MHPQHTDVSNQTPTGDAHRLIHGIGPMADRIRAYPWSSTPLGPVGTWPLELLSTVNLALSSPVAMQIFWGPDMITLYNDGITPFVLGKNALGQPARQVWAEVWPDVGTQLEGVLAFGQPVSFQHVFLRLMRDGILTDMYWDYVYTPIVSAQGDIVGILDIAQDVTQTVQAQLDLKASQAQASRILRSIGDAVIVTDIDTRITRMNPVAEELTGWLLADALGKPLTEVFCILNESTREPSESPAHKVLRTGRVVGLANHTILVARNGREVSIDDSGAPIRDDNGHITGIVLVFRDIAERRATERELAQNTRRQAVLVDFFNALRNGTDPDLLMQAACDLVARKLQVDRIGFFTVTSEKQILYGIGRADGNLPLLQGGEPADWIGPAVDAMAQTGATVAIDDTRTDPLTADTGFADNGIIGNLGVPFVRDGRWVGGFYAHHSQPRVWSHNDVYFFRQVADNTWAAVERLRTMHALSVSEERFRSTFNNAPIGIAVSQLDGTLVDFNREYERLTGQTRQDLLGEDFLLLLPAKEIESNRAQFRKLLDGTIPSADAEMHYLRPDGTTQLVRANSTLIRDENGKPELILGIIEDIELRRKTEAALIQNEKLAAVGRLAASIAHEINNPLESVTNLIYLARHSQALSESQEYLDLAERELRRVSAITSQTLRFHRQSTAPTPTFCSDLFTDTLSIYQGRLVNSHIEVDERKRAERAVTCFSGEIRQVLSNLIGNAIDSMPGGGTLYVRSRDATNRTTGMEGIVLTVADTGTGMSADVQQKVFDAFFTTKGIGGTGLGLWISSEIIARHHGALRLRSSQNPARHGTVFTLFLPSDIAPASPVQILSSPIQT